MTQLRALTLAVTWHPVIATRISIRHEGCPVSNTMFPRTASLTLRPTASLPGDKSSITTINFAAAITELDRFCLLRTSTNLNWTVELERAQLPAVILSAKTLTQISYRIANVFRSLVNCGPISSGAEPAVTRRRKQNQKFSLRFACDESRQREGCPSLIPFRTQIEGFGGSYVRSRRHSVR
jgi:hypothetical protein